MILPLVCSSSMSWQLKLISVHISHSISERQMLMDGIRNVWKILRCACGRRALIAVFCGTLRWCMTNAVSGNAISAGICYNFSRECTLKARLGYEIILIWEHWIKRPLGRSFYVYKVSVSYLKYKFGVKFYM